MTWIYHQSDGRLYHNSTYVDTGYSGHGPVKIIRRLKQEHMSAPFRKENIE
jgi:hypothetical protein